MYQKIGQGDEIVDEKPLEAIANEAHEGSNEHDKGERKVHEGKPRGPPKELAHVVGSGEVVQLHLRDVENRLHG